MPGANLRNVDSHFAFGENWASYASLIDEAAIAESTKGLLRLIPAEDFQGRSFIDIGCGSGLHALAAARLGVSRILAVDIDPDSVGTTKSLLSAHKTTVPWQAEQISVFDLDPLRHGTFDIVYSWGVLHHTGDMSEALKKASALVAPNGLFTVALYRTTSIDPFWKIEKRWYTRASPLAQRFARGCFVATHRTVHALSRRGNFRKFIETYQSSRGMDFNHDVHDWLGGYPYESITPEEVDALLSGFGLVRVRTFTQPPSIGLLGSGCDEYVYRRG